MDQSTSEQPQPKKILIVEDDGLIRDLYAKVLKSEGYSVDEADDGQKGYDALHKGGYDLVLLDIMLPVMDGLQILKKLNENVPEKPNKSILLLTNLDQDMTIAKSMAYGAAGYFVKSQFTIDQMKSEIKSELAKNS